MPVIARVGRGRGSAATGAAAAWSRYSTRWWSRRH